jgi:cytochrome P450
VTSEIDYNPFAPDFYTSDSLDVYRRLRDEAPVYYSERWGWWALSRFEDVRPALMDPETFRSFEGMDIDDTGKDQKGPGSLPDMDNPRHGQIRRLVQPFSYVHMGEFARLVPVLRVRSVVMTVPNRQPHVEAVAHTTTTVTLVSHEFEPTSASSASERSPTA